MSARSRALHIRSAFAAALALVCVLPGVAFAGYGQSSYYGQGTYYSQSTYYSQASYYATNAANSCNQNYQLFGIPGSYTFTVPAGVTSLRVVVIGAGGGGGAGSGGWGSGGGGACGGGVAGQVVSVTPGQNFPVTVGYGGAGGNGSGQCTVSGYPWCGTFYAGSNGSVGGSSSFGSLAAAGGSWGRTGFYNLFNNYTGGSGGGSGGGGGGNGWPGYYAISGAGGRAGGQTNSQGAGGYCIGGGWGVSPVSYIKNVNWSVGDGGYSPGGYTYWGGGGGGGVVINGSSINGADGQSSPNNGGKGYGGGGGGSNLDNTGYGGTGASGAVYIEWDTSGTNSACTPSCQISFDQNPLTSASTIMRWTSQNAALFWISGVGYVSSSGSTRVYSAGTYSGTVANSDGDTAQCTATLATQSQCGATQCQSDGNLHDACGNVTACSYGCSALTNSCKAQQSCTSTPTCSADGSQVVDSCSGAIINNCTAVGESCVSGVCSFPPMVFEGFIGNNGTATFSATGHLQASPALVRRGSNTHLFWDVKNAKSCTVKKNGTLVSSATYSGTTGVSVGPITGESTYALHCDAQSTATPQTIDESVVVKVVPTYNEQ